MKQEAGKAGVAAYRRTNHILTATILLAVTFIMGMSGLGGSLGQHISTVADTPLANYVPPAVAADAYVGGVVREGYNFSWASPLNYQTIDTATCTTNPCPSTVGTFPAHLANSSGNNIVLQPQALAIPGVIQHNLWVQNYTSCGGGLGHTSGLPSGSKDCEQWWYSGSWNDFLFESGGGNTPTATAGTSTLGAPDITLHFNGSNAVSNIDTGMYLTVNASKLPSGTSTADYITLQYSVTSSTATAGDGFVVP